MGFPVLLISFSLPLASAIKDRLNRRARIEKVFFIEALCFLKIEWMIHSSKKHQQKNHRSIHPEK
jgi:hypothetical protein